MYKVINTKTNKVVLTTSDYKMASVAVYRLEQRNVNVYYKLVIEGSK